MSYEEFGRDHRIYDAEGEVAVNSQAKGPDSDDTLESQFGTEEANFVNVMQGESFR